MIHKFEPSRKDWEQRGFIIAYQQGPDLKGEYFEIENDEELHKFFNDFWAGKHGKTK